MSAAGTGRVSGRGSVRSPKPLSARRGTKAAAAAGTGAEPAAAPPPAPGARSTTRRSMSTNRPESGRFDQSALAVTWNSTTRPLPWRSAVTSGVPSARLAHTLSGSSAVGLGQHLAGHAGRWDRAARPAKGLVSGKSLQSLRLLPAQRAAKRAVAFAQASPGQVVLGAGEPRPGKAQQHAAALDPFGSIASCGVGAATRRYRRAPASTGRHRGVSFKTCSIGGFAQFGDRAPGRARHNRAATAAAGRPRSRCRSGGPRSCGASGRRRGRRARGVALAAIWMRCDFVAQFDRQFDGALRPWRRRRRKSAVRSASSRPLPARARAVASRGLADGAQGGDLGCVRLRWRAGVSASGNCEASGTMTSSAAPIIERSSPRQSPRPCHDRGRRDSQMTRSAGRQAGLLQPLQQGRDGRDRGPWARVRPPGLRAAAAADDSRPEGRASGTVVASVTVRIGAARVGEDLGQDRAGACPSPWRAAQLSSMTSSSGWRLTPATWPGA